MPNWKSFVHPVLTIAGVLVPQIAQVEAAIKEVKSGPDKKKAVLDTVASSMALAEALAGHEIVDEALLAEGLSELNDASVKIMKALKVKAPVPSTSGVH